MTTESVGHTKGPWEVFIDDSGGPASGWPLSVTAVNDPDKMVVRTGGQWPYEWDRATSQREAVANARLIAAAPDLLAWLIRCEEMVSTDKGPPDWDAVRAVINKATSHAE